MRARFSSVTVATLIVASCSSPSASTDAGPRDAGPTDAGPPCTMMLAPGATPDMDQTNFQMAAVNAADNAVICIAPGHYHFVDQIAFTGRTGVIVRGMGSTPGATMLDFATQTASERGLSFTNMTNVSVENLEVLDAVHDDVYFQHCTGVTVRHVVAGWMNRTMHGAYAIYPVESMNVLLDSCEAFGSADAGLYVGQTTNCIVRNSLVHDNVAGLEIENSTNCEVYGNTTHDNTAGILVFELPSLPHQGMSTSVHDNVSMNNNTLNFATGGIVRYVPEGLGIMVMAAHEIEVSHNMVSGNGTVGILLVSYATAVVAGAPAAMDPAYDGYLRHVYVHDNTMSNNSMMPNSQVMGLAQLDMGTTVDVLWDEQVGPNDVPPQICFANSGHFRAVDGPHGFATVSDTVPAAFASCMTPVIPPVML
jgi:parallel beta-helix repeat protein